MEAASLGKKGLVEGLRIPGGLGLMVLMVTLWMLGGAMIQPFFNLYFQRIHEMPIPRIGGVFAVSQLVTALVVVLSGELASRLGPSRVMGGWVAVFAVAVVLLPLTEVTLLATGLFLLFGFVGPSTNPLIDQALQERAPPGRRGAVSSWRSAATFTSGLVGASAGGYVLEILSFSWLFTAAAVVGAVGGAGMVATALAVDRREREAGAEGVGSGPAGIRPGPEDGGPGGSGAAEPVGEAAP